MLWNKVQAAAGAKKAGLMFTANYTNLVRNVTTTTYTIPSSGPSVGDLAILHYTVLEGYLAATPTGWTQISVTPTLAGRQVQRVIGKVLVSSDLGSVLTLTTDSAVSSTYGTARFVTFTPSSTITGFNVSSLTVDSGTVPTRTKDTSTYPAPNIIFAAASLYNGAANGGYSETYWNQEYISLGSVTTITAYEIQNTTNTNRTVTPLFTGTALINHSFVLNAIV